MVPLERPADGVCRLLVLGANLCCRRCRTHGREPGEHSLAVSSDLDCVVGVLYFVVLKTPPGYVVGVVTAIVVVIAAWLFVKFIPVGQDDNHVLSIGIGGGFGIIMLMNVWGIIWRNNKRIIQGTLAGSPPANAAVLARQAFLASRTNFFLSVPMLFFMAASSHYTILGK